ncbi:hypothetical protein KIW84_058010 [Lathyrus oleraceus]|uniref:Chorein N-terminal domain-containing protein n=1 Tax=Pisum sativum TaxID=3888 RepID=A0A9D5APN9_PEA|nr:hypothetical protein KIW84_058010 [Pisum sativum]
MFEGLVHQLLLGYLGRYFKDIQKRQLKIRLEEVLLENVELILEAFDYLQLPFTLKQGRVGRLSIKIPWKKPWDPIIIILEDVFISASKRDDQEWSADAVEKREFVGKKGWGNYPDVDVQNDLGHISLGLKFSNLTMKQNLVGDVGCNVDIRRAPEILGKIYRSGETPTVVTYSTYIKGLVKLSHIIYVNPSSITY